MYTVSRSARASEVPAASQTAARFCRHTRACSAAVSAASSPVAGSSGI